MNHNFVEKAIPMVSVDDKTGKYVLTTQALKFFKSIEGPIAVVSVAGLYRTGKSYLLNRVLLNKSAGFGVGPTVNPCTKGLWCWGAPIKGTSSDGEDVSIVVIDTEGIGALDEDQTHDTKIFTLAILASSCFIYNSVGSIDETAIQNLSLVVNLTKHIQLRSTEEESEEGVDPDEISTCFPTFYWVVRDFSLQLQDAEGNSISSREYLEKALAPHNGFSDDIEEKNRIRRLLTAFFKDRDCFTMIRPLVDEMKLQNLDKMDYDELRPEFVSQAMALRKRIITSVKAKSLQNKKLNGTLYCSMISSYVAAINDGAVPNIENAWNYMCEEQCRRAMEECYEIYIRSIQQSIRELPKSEETFETCVAEAQDRALEAYREKALGPRSAIGYAELKNKIKAQTAEMREENIKQSNASIREYIVKNVTPITKNLNKNQFTSYAEYQKEVTNMSEKFLKEGPKLHNYKYIYLEAIRKLSSQGADFLFKKFTKEQEKANQMNREKERHLIGEMTKLKEDYETLRNNFNEAVSTADQKIFQLTNKEETLRSQLAITMKSQKDQQGKSKREFQQKFADQQAKYRLLEEKFNDMSAKLSETSKSFASEQAQWLNQKAVFEQQIKHQLLQIDELQKSAKNLEVSLNVKQSNMSKEVRDLTTRLETEKEELKLKLADSTEKVSELGSELSSLKIQLNEKVEDFEKKEKKLKEDFNNSKREMEKLKKESEAEKRQLREQLQTIHEKFEKEVTGYKATISQLEKDMKEANDKLRLTKNSLETAREMHEQQLSYYKNDNEMLKTKYNNLKESYDMHLTTYRNSSQNENQESMKSKLNKMASEHSAEIDSLTQCFKMEIDKRINELNVINNRYSQLEREYSSYKTEKNINEINMKFNVTSLNEKIDQLMNEKNNLENKLKAQMSERQEHFQQKYRDLESEFENYKDNSIAEYERLQHQTNEKLEGLKFHSELMSQDIEKRLGMERDKYAKKINSLNEEHERTLSEERENFQNQIDDLAEKLESTVDELRSRSQEYQHNNDMLNKQVLNLTEMNKELKETIEKKEQEFNTKEANFLSQFKSEKEKLESKLETLISDFNQKERECMNLKHENSQMTSSLEKRESKISEQEIELQKLNERYMSEVEKLTTKNKAIEIQMMEKTTNLSRDLALLDQKLQFETNRNKEFEQTLSTITKTSEEKFSQLKTEKEEQMKAMAAKLTLEKTQIDNKYQQLKVSSKDIESNLRKALNQTYMSKSLLEERASNLEIRLREAETSKIEEVANLRADLIKTKETLSLKEKEYQDNFKIFNQKIEKLENEKIDIVMAAEREKALSDQRYANLLKSKEDYRTQAEQKIKIIENKLGGQVNCLKDEKSIISSEYQQHVSAIQSKNNIKVQQLNDTISKNKFEADTAIREREVTIKELNEKLENEKNTNSIRIYNNEKKISELIENEKRLTEELEKIKKDKSSREMEILRKEQNEKENLKKRITEYENKLKDANSKSMQHNFQMEKERSKWTFQKQSILEKSNEYKESFEKMKRDHDKLKVENEKLKGDRRPKHTNYISGLKTVVEPKIEKSVTIEDPNKENANYQ